MQASHSCQSPVYPYNSCQSPIYPLFLVWSSVYPDLKLCSKREAATQCWTAKLIFSRLCSPLVAPSALDVLSCMKITQSPSPTFETWGQAYGVGKTKTTNFAFMGGRLRTLGKNRGATSKKQFCILCYHYLHNQFSFCIHSLSPFLHSAFHAEYVVRSILK